MLCNLQELQYNLKALLHELSGMHNKLINPIEAKKSNAHSLLMKLPKIILLIKIIPYLGAPDCISLSTVCVGMRRTIYSPIGWKILNRIQSPYPLFFKEIIINSEIQKIDPSISQKQNYALNMIDDQKLLKKARLQCKKSLLQVFQKYRLKEEECVQMMRQLKSSKTLVIKLGMYRTYLQSRKETLEQQNSSYRTELKLINKGFSDKIKQLDILNQQLVKQRSKLQNQKQALVGKIREYQSEIQTVKIDSQKSKQILKKIKNYLLYKEL